MSGQNDHRAASLLRRREPPTPRAERVQADFGRHLKDRGLTPATVDAHLGRLSVLLWRLHQTGQLDRYLDSKDPVLRLQITGGIVEDVRREGASGGQLERLQSSLSHWQLSCKAPETRIGENGPARRSDGRFPRRTGLTAQATGAQARLEEHLRQRGMVEWSVDVKTHWASILLYELEIRGDLDAFLSPPHIDLRRTAVKETAARMQRAGATRGQVLALLNAANHLVNALHLPNGRRHCTEDVAGVLDETAPTRRHPPDPPSDPGHAAALLRLQAGLEQAGYDHHIVAVYRRRAGSLLEFSASDPAHLDTLLTGADEDSVRRRRQLIETWLHAQAGRLSLDTRRAALAAVHALLAAHQLPPAGVGLQAGKARSNDATLTGPDRQRLLGHIGQLTDERRAAALQLLTRSALTHEQVAALDLDDLDLLGTTGQLTIRPATGLPARPTYLDQPVRASLELLLERRFPEHDRLRGHRFALFTDQLGQRVKAVGVRDWLRQATEATAISTTPHAVRMAAVADLLDALDLTYETALPALTGQTSRRLTTDLARRSSDSPGHEPAAPGRSQQKPPRASRPSAAVQAEPSSRV